MQIKKMGIVSPKLISLFLFFSLNSYGECVARGYRLGTEAPLYNLESCSIASKVIDVNKIGELFPHPVEDDKAIWVTPANQSSSDAIKSKGEYWHYSGACSDLPFNRTVHLELKIHCSDLGITMQGLLGDVSIISAVPLNTDDLYLFHPLRRQEISNFFNLANVNKIQGSSFPAQESPLEQLLPANQLIDQVQEYSVEKLNTLIAIIDGPQLRADWFVFEDQLWLTGLKFDLDNSQYVDLKSIFSEENHTFKGNGMLKASWFSGKLHYRIGPTALEPSTGRLGYEAVVFEIEDGDILSREVKTAVPMSERAPYF